jgi:hypothetical protein
MCCSFGFTKWQQQQQQWLNCHRFQWQHGLVSVGLLHKALRGAAAWRVHRSTAAAGTGAAWRHVTITCWRQQQQQQGIVSA